MSNPGAGGRGSQTACPGLVCPLRGEWFSVIHVRTEPSPLEYVHVFSGPLRLLRGLKGTWYVGNEVPTGH